MTHLIFGSPPFSYRPNADPLTEDEVRAILESFPGPPRETEARKRERCEGRLRDVLPLRPRNAMEVIFAIQCTVIRECGIGAGPEPETAQYRERRMRQRSLRFREMEALAKMLIKASVEDRRQRSQPAPPPARVIVQAVIVPTHPAPTMLQ